MKRQLGFVVLWLLGSLAVHATEPWTLERALEYIDVDEFVEATPKNLRLRKKELDEGLRRRTEKTRVIKFVQE